MKHYGAAPLQRQTIPLSNVDLGQSSLHDQWAGDSPRGQCPGQCKAADLKAPLGYTDEPPLDPVGWCDSCLLVTCGVTSAF